MDKLSFKYALLSTLFLGACSGSSSNSPSELPVANTQPDVVENTQQKITINQLGYFETSNKIAIVPNVASTSFTVLDASNNEEVYSGTLSSPNNWADAGSESIKQADFTNLITPGSYFIRVAGIDDSSTFKIDEQVYDELHTAAQRYFYLNRSGIEIEQQFAGTFARPLGHIDNSVMYHPSADEQLSANGQSIASSKGWYDAGDYGKYVVNSGISTYTLLAAYEHSTGIYNQEQLNIPESGDAIPDILNETLWNLEWLITMQADDGGVYHKLTTLDWPGYEMPHEDTRTRFMIGKSTAASLNFAATFAVASRVIAPFDESKSEQYLLAAIDAWKWALEHPSQIYVQPSDVQSGEYGDDILKDEFAWAAAELFISTRVEGFFTTYKALDIEYSTPSWRNVSYLSLSSLLYKAGDLLSPQEYATLKDKQKNLADTFVQQQQSNAYLVPMQTSDFVWGSNSVALNKAMILLQAAQIQNDSQYRQVAQGIVDYVLGRNPTEYSFVTGFGHKAPVNPHHRISQSDGISEPVPGMLVGGPHAGRQDECDYKYNEPARTYSDSWCSYSTNEVAINWNAPLVYVLGMLIERK